MKILKSLSRKEFKNRFGTIEQCLAYLADEKWRFGYSCTKCQNENYSKGKKMYNRRCSMCGYDESPTANTLFHKVKFGIDNAFEMAYDITTSKKGASSIWLAERYGVKQMTAWLFRRKVQHAMKSSEKHPLKNEVHVDEFEIGTPQKGEQGRSKTENKIRVVIALEYRRGKAGRGYAKVIEDYSSKSLSDIFEKHISEEAKIVTDGWSGYKPLMNKYPHLEQRLSDKGENFKMLHIQIRNFKNWLRGVHSYCDKETLDQYIQEYFFRFNRLNFRENILDKLLCRMVGENPRTYKSLKCNVK
jgi:transposase-like protein